MLQKIKNREGFTLIELLLVIVVLIILTGAIFWISGPVRASLARIKESWSYETWTGRTADIELYSGSQLIKQFEKAKITYASANSRTMTFVVDRKKYHWQGDALLKEPEK